MSFMIAIAGTVAGTVFGAYALRDLYACTGHIQRGMLRTAVWFMPAHMRDETYKQWQADILAMPPSELLRTAYALDCIRGGAVIGARERIKANRLAANGQKRTTSKLHVVNVTILRSYAISHFIVRTTLMLGEFPLNVWALKRLRELIMERLPPEQ